MSLGKVVAVVQARMGSSRLPNKVMAPITGKPMIELLLTRLSLCPSIDEIVVATSEAEENKPLKDHVAKLGYRFTTGSEEDVLERFAHAATVSRADTILRVTGDCPLISPALVEKCIALYKSEGAEYASNIAPPTFPDGQDIEVFSKKLLKDVALNATKIYDREHVTTYIRESSAFRKANLTHQTDLSQRRWTVDEPADLEVISNIFEHLHLESTSSGPTS